LGSNDFISRHSTEDKKLKEIPRAQLKAIKPTLERIFAKDIEAGIARRIESMGIGCKKSPGTWESTTRP
jgi:hypothetical protein